MNCALWLCHAFDPILCVWSTREPGVAAQAYHDLLPYRKFTLTYSLADTPRLPRLLRSIPRRRVCQLRAQAAFYYRALMWQEPDGLACTLLLMMCVVHVLGAHKCSDPVCNDAGPHAQTRVHTPD